MKYDGTYIDRALSARTDNRPAFQEMIEDSEKKTFEAVLVWKLDRFSRDRYDSAFYKHQLKKNGVRVISATENISDGPEGIILESMLEGMAEYYSAELAVKIRRGQTDNAMKCKNNGGSIPLGFYVGTDGVLTIREDTAPIVREIFRRYDSGESMQVIVNSLNERGLKTQKGSTFRVSNLGTILKNRKYIGEYKYGKIVIPDGIPAIIDAELFDRVQQRLATNKMAPARAKADEENLLTTKLFCGECGRLLAGESGKGHNGTVYYYYKCSGAKRKKGCNLKAIKKNWIEKIAVQMTVQRVLQDTEIDRIADAILALQNQEDPAIPALTAELKNCEHKIENLMDAIMDGIRTSSTKARLEELEAQRENLQTAILQARLRRPVYTKEQIVRWISKFKSGNIDDLNYQKQIIDIFINAVYVYNDRFVFTYNFKDGTETVSLKEIEEAYQKDGSTVDSSDLTNIASPNP